MHCKHQYSAPVNILTMSLEFQWDCQELMFKIHSDAGTFIYVIDFQPMVLDSCQLFPSLIPNS